MHGWKRAMGLAIAVALLGSFFALFWWAYQPFASNQPHESPVPSGAQKVGTIRGYSYVLTQGGLDRGQYSATFNPAIRNDDTEVLDVLPGLVLAAYGAPVDGVQPTVEVIREYQFITFTQNQHRVIFQLTKNAQGAVVSVKFWKD